MSSGLRLWIALKRGASRPSAGVVGQGAAPLSAARSRGAFAGHLGRYLLLIGLSLPALVINLGAYPAAWHDEGSRTNAARTLAERGLYGTYTTAGFRPFDPYITSGPMDVLAVATSFKLFGLGVVQGRLGLLPFAVLAVVSLLAIASFVFGPKIGLLAALTVLAVPAIDGVSLLLLGRQVLGEVPSLALILAGLYLWFRSWSAATHWPLALFAGLALGLGLLSKTSLALAVLPALGMVALGRWLTRRSHWLDLLVPIATAVGVLLGWRLLEYVFTPPAIYAENVATLADAVRTLILTRAGGQALPKSGLLLTGLMLLGAAGAAWRLTRARRTLSLLTEAQWAEATLALIAVCYAAWYALLSIGWPRYAFFGEMIGLLLAGGCAWDLLWRAQRFTQWDPKRAYSISAAAVAVIALGVNTWPVVTHPGDDAPQQVASYIDTHIPPQAVIESWDWELDALTSHWQFHHPPAALEYLADRQLFMERTDFNLGYDWLPADPDYVIVGPFSDWTKLYAPQVLQQQFVLATQIGPYRVYRRAGL